MIMVKPTRSSYSSLKLFEQCPYAWEKAYIEGIRGEGGPAAKRGTRLHLAGERYINDEITVDQLPIEYNHFKNDLALIKQLGGKAEEVWVVNKNWERCDEDSHGAWLKAIIDLHYFTGSGQEHVCNIIDFKSGRVRSEHKYQLELYLCIAAGIFPEATRFTATCFYLDHNKPGHYVEYNGVWLKLLREGWGKRINKQLAAKKYPATPSRDSCFFCPHKASKGGPCKKEWKEGNEDA